MAGMNEWIITVVSYSVIQECLLRSALRPASFKQNGLEGMEERDEVTNRCMMKCGKKFRTNDREGTALFDGSPRAEDKKFSLRGWAEKTAFICFSCFWQNRFSFREVGQVISLSSTCDFQRNIFNFNASILSVALKISMSLAWRLRLSSFRFEKTSVKWHSLVSRLSHHSFTSWKRELTSSVD